MRRRLRFAAVAAVALTAVAACFVPFGQLRADIAAFGLSWDSLSPAALFGSPMKRRALAFALAYELWEPDRQPQRGRLPESLDATDDGAPAGPHRFAEPAAEAPVDRLFYVFPADGSLYRNLPDGSLPVGTAVVKETWHGREAALYAGELDGSRPTVELNGTAYGAWKRSEVFVMYKLDPATPDTDGGWVYAVLTPDRAEVTAVGYIQSCVDCHALAPHDRLFGVRRR
jgi:hypothetical protein